MTNWILTAIYKSIWGVFISGPLYLVSGFNDVLYYLSGGVVWDLLFGGKKDFSWDAIPIAFFGFCIIAAVIACIIFLTQYLTLLFSDTKQVRSKIVTATKMTGFACVFIFFIPIAYFLLNQIIMFVSGTLNSVFGVKNLNIAGMVWNIGNPDWNGKDVYNGNFFNTPNNILNYNIMAEIFGTFFVTYAIIMLGLALVQKVFELFFLFVISPVVATTMINDNGKRMMIWKDYVIAKSLASLGTVIAYYTFMIGICAILGNALGSFNGASRQVMIILLLCGGALSCMGMSSIIASFVGEGVGIREGMASISSTIAAAKLTMGASKMVGRAIGFGKNKKAQLTGVSGTSNDYGIEQSQVFATKNAGTDKVMANINDGFKIPNTGMRSRSGLIRMTGTALALAATSVYAISSGVKKSWAGSEGLHGTTRLRRAVTRGAASAVAQPVKFVGTKIAKGAVNVGKAVKENTHGVYKAKHAHANPGTSDDSKISK